MPDARTAGLWMADGSAEAELVAWLLRIGPSTDTLCACVLDLPRRESLDFLEQLERCGVLQSRVVGDPDAVVPLREWSVVTTGQPEDD
jgi:hypothetical protein